MIPLAESRSLRSWPTTEEPDESIVSATIATTTDESILLLTVDCLA